jgi:hypothetical protein
MRCVVERWMKEAHEGKKKKRNNTRRNHRKPPGTDDKRRDHCIVMPHHLCFRCCLCCRCEKREQMRFFDEMEMENFQEEV